jgi:uncharacterized protein YjbI with pentapeptide repeats
MSCWFAIGGPRTRRLLVGQDAAVGDTAPGPVRRVSRAILGWMRRVSQAILGWLKPKRPAAAGRHAPQLRPIWLVLALAVLGAAAVGYGIYAVLRDIAEPKETSLDVLRGALGVAAFFAAILAGVYAYRKQLLAEGDARRSDAEQLAARYTTAAEQLGHEKAAVRLAGVYAMARLADDWPEERQTCIDVLCAYLRMPYEPDLEAGEREVGHTIIRVITDHLQDPKAATSWCGRNLDFTGAVFDGGTFTRAKFSGGRVSFNGAEFFARSVLFNGAEFSGSEVSFEGAKFSGGVVSFGGAEFSGGKVNFDSAEFSGGVVSFASAKFSGGVVSFASAKFSGGGVSFQGAKFSGGTIFLGAEFSGSKVSFDSAEFSDGKVYFEFARFSDGEVSFRPTADWSHPPHFDFAEPPPGVLLPDEADVGAPAQDASLSAANDELET